MIVCKGKASVVVGGGCCMSGKAPPTGPRALRVNAQDQRQPRSTTVPTAPRDEAEL